MIPEMKKEVDEKVGCISSLSVFCLHLMGIKACFWYKSFLSHERGLVRNKCSSDLAILTPTKMSWENGRVCSHSITGGQLTRTRRISDTCFEKHPVKNFGKHCEKYYDIPFTLKPIGCHNRPSFWVKPKFSNDMMIYLRSNSYAVNNM